MDYAQGYRDGYMAGLAAGAYDAQVGRVPQVPPMMAPAVEAPAPKKRKVSAYSRAYGRAYKALRRKHTLKNGKLRKGYTHKRLVRLAHAEAKRRRKK